MDTVSRCALQVVVAVLLVLGSACGGSPIHNDPEDGRDVPGDSVPRAPLDTRFNGVWTGTEIVSRCAGVVGPCDERIGEFSATYTINVHGTTATFQLGCPDGSVALTTSGPNYPVTGHGASDSAEWGTDAVCMSTTPCGERQYWRYTGQIAMEADGSAMMKGWGYIIECGTTSEIQWVSTLRKVPTANP